MLMYTTVNYHIFHLLSTKKVNISWPVILQTETTQIITQVLPKLHDTKQNINKMKPVGLGFGQAQKCDGVKHGITSLLS